MNNLLEIPWLVISGGRIWIHAARSKVYAISPSIFNIEIK